MKQRPPPAHRGLWYYLRCKALRRPVLLNVEFTKRCNARCRFCSCWQVDSSGDLEDYSPIVKKFRPVVVSVSGGEPLLRRNYPELIRAMRPYCHYMAIITNGTLLNVESAKKLVDAGVNNISVSLDFLGKKHDEARQIDGLFEHLSETIPAIARAGYRIALNTIIMESNLDEIVSMAHQAAKWGVEVSFSSYCSLKRDNENEMIQNERYAHLVAIVDEIRRLKSKLKNIKNSDYYLRNLPKYFRDGGIAGCKAGYRWLQITPDGYVQQCSEMPRICHYTEFTRKRISPVTCSKCWYTCRGEAEANPVEPKRLLELMRS